MTNFRDVEKLSAYLDGQLKDSEAARLETRLKTNSDLASLLEELRQSRAILRKLPQRRAPRNFTLTPKMVRQRPPLPRAYPYFRFATALATFLLIFSFAANLAAPGLRRMAASPGYLYGIGGGGGGGGDAEEPEMAMESAPMEEAMAPTEEPMPEALAPAPAEGVATEEPAEMPPAAEGLLTPTASVSDDTEARAEPTTEAFQKNGVQDQGPVGTETVAGPEIPAPGEEGRIASPGAVIPMFWQIVLGILVFANFAILFVMRKNAAAKWQTPK